MDSMGCGMLYLQPWGFLMLHSQRGDPKHLNIFPFRKYNFTGQREGVWGEHLICTLQLAELELKMPFYFDILFFMAELQEV